MDEKKLHTCEFRPRGSSKNMRSKLLQKRFTGKTTECSKHLHHIAIEKNILSELNRCILQISLKYIKLFQKYSLYWYYAHLILLQNYMTPPPPPAPNEITPPSTKIKISDTPSPPPPPHTHTKTFLKFLPPPPKLERRCMPV